jgi:hypothetical protein
MAIGRVVNRSQPGKSPAKIWGAVISAAASLYSGYKNRKMAKSQQRTADAAAAARQKEMEAGKKAYMDMKFENPYENISNPYDGMVNPWATVENPYANQGNPFAAVTNPFANMRNAYGDMENTMEDLTVDQKAARFMQAENAKSTANLLNSLKSSAGGSGIASLAQALANQSTNANAKAAANIASQESANKRAAAEQAAKNQELEAKGDMETQQAKAKGEFMKQELQGKGQFMADELKGKGQIHADTLKGKGELMVAEMIAGGEQNKEKLQAMGMQYVQDSEASRIRAIYGMGIAASTAANTAAVNAQGQVNKATGSMWGAVGDLATGIAGTEWGQSKLNGMFGGGTPDGTAVTKTK